MKQSPSRSAFLSSLLGSSSSSEAPGAEPGLSARSRLAAALAEYLEGMERCLAAVDRMVAEEKAAGRDKE